VDKEGDLIASFIQSRLFTAVVMLAKSDVRNTRQLIWEQMKEIENKLRKIKWVSANKGSLPFLPRPK